jgi:hypothetical protein
LRWSFIVVLVLAAGACVSPQSWEAVRLLKDIEARDAPSDLKAMTPAPDRREIAFQIDGRPSVADIYDPRQPIGARLVLVPGFTPHGKDDAQLVDLAYSLARARFLVLVPDLAGTRAVQVRLADAQGIADAVRHLDERPAAAPQGVGVMAISYAVGLALSASLQPDVIDRVRFVVSLGGYYDAAGIVRFMTTGYYRERPGAPWRVKTPRRSARWFFMASNTDLLDDPGDRAALAQAAARRMRDPEAPIGPLIDRLTPEGRSLFDLLTATDPDRVDDLIARLPATARRQLDDLSPRNMALSRLAGRLILIHGAEDTLVP